MSAAAASSSNSGQNWDTIIMAGFNTRFNPAKTKAALQDALNYGLATMLSSTPVRTGYLKGSEGVSVTSDTEGEMHANAEYAGYVNGGTIHMSPNPFFDRGVATTETRLRENLSKL